MKYDFGFSMYFIEGPELTSLEKFYIHVQHKLHIYKRHTETTVKLYQDEFKDLMVNHKESYNAAITVAKDAYKRYYEEIEGDDQDKHSFAIHESGIDEIQYHFSIKEESLKNNFAEMADHFNKSAMVTLYALMETELRRLCSHLQAHFKKRVTLDRFEQTDYFKSILEYLDQVIELDITSLQYFQTKIVPLQFLRNKIMHNGGEFPLTTTEYLDELVKGSGGSLRLEEISDEQSVIVRIKSSFLIPFYELIGELFIELYRLLNSKELFVFLSGRLSFLFQFLASDVSVIYQEHKAVRNGQLYTFLIESKVADPPFVFLCKFTIAESVKHEIVITNQLDHEIKNLDRLFEGIDKYDHVIRQTMDGFFNSEKMYRFEFLLYPVSQTA